jgi:hypothetical protein
MQIMIINTSYIKNQIRAANRIAKFIGVIFDYLSVTYDKSTRITRLLKRMA